MPYKALLWGTKNEFQAHYNSIKLQEQMGMLEVAGISSEDTIYKSVWGYPFVPEQEISDLQADIVIVLAPAELLPQAYARLSSAGIARGQCLRGEVLSIPGFDLEQYMLLRRRPVSILSSNCFGGILYHHLDLPFCSPTVNLWLPTGDFLRLAMHLPDYIHQEPEPERVAWDALTQLNYPVMRLGDLLLHCNHTDSAEQAAADWQRRMARLDPGNVFVVMNLIQPDSLRYFHKIPYRKLCFTIFPTDEPDTLYLPLTAGRTKVWEMENGCASGMYQIFDPLKLLLGRKDYMVSELV